MRVIAFVFLVLSLGFGQSNAKRLSSAHDYRKYIDPLVSVPDFGRLYYDDGAADGSVLFTVDAKGLQGPPKKEVEAILDLKSASIPLLIDCLSDTRLTSATFSGDWGENAKVAVGYICMDLLTVTTRGPQGSQMGCEYDGLGSCMAEGYHFRPDDYIRRIRAYDAKPWIRQVQRNWRTIHSRKQVRFKDPFVALKEIR